MLRFNFYILSVLWLFILVDLSVAQTNTLGIADDLIINSKEEFDKSYEDKKLSIIEEVPDTKYSKIKSHQNYQNSSAKQKTIYDINNYGLNTDNPYEVNDYKLKKNINFLSKKQNSNHQIDNNFYVMFQLNLLLPNSFYLKEPNYFGKVLPELPGGAASPYSDAYNFLPNGKRIGTYSALSASDILMYPYLSFGIRTNNIFRFEISRLSTRIKLQNDKNEHGSNNSYTFGYSNRSIDMDFKQQVYLLNSFIDLKLNRMWLYLGAGLGVVNNQLNKFTINIEDNNKKYELNSIINKKSLYKHATMLSLGLYSKVYDDTFIDISLKKMSLGKISTLKDYKLTQTNKATSASISDIVTMNILEMKTRPYLISIGIRQEF